uniref:Uncharacterized protein n=1 Tax=Trichogramma kaykai TaxID=54128 RepID=A0ABD2WYX4_9HYME
MEVLYLFSRGVRVLEKAQLDRVIDANSKNRVLAHPYYFLSCLPQLWNPFDSLHFSTLSRTRVSERDPHFPPWIARICELPSNANRLSAPCTAPSGANNRLKFMNRTSVGVDARKHIELDDMMSRIVDTLMPLAYALLTLLMPRASVSGNRRDEFLLARVSHSTQLAVALSTGRIDFHRVPGSIVCTRCRS